ncbi:MAG: hypothetical protein GWP91_07410 [Rhodobacterales bacterium]|nr:hypothetical protein [Rhodobacterales bacterium]
MKRFTAIGLVCALALPAYAQDKTVTPPSDGPTVTRPADAEDNVTEAEEAPEAHPSHTVSPPEPGPDFESLQAQMAAQAEVLAAQQVALEDLQEQLARTQLERIKPTKIEYGVEGHYRVRGYIFNHLFSSQTEGKSYLGDARYMQQRLWLRPTFNYNDLAKAFVEVRALDDAILGDNMSLGSTALFADTPSNTNLTGQDFGSVNISRAWMEVTLPVGILRVGRQPSQWGMGLLANDGEGFDQTFGEKHYGSTNDRILFATRPLAIYEKITGKEDSGIPLIAAVAVDRLVEDPLTQYYGFKCSPGLVQGVDDDYSRTCDPDGDGTTDLDHSYTDDEFLASDRGQDWWADQNDDVMQMVYVLAYRGEDVNYLGGTNDLTIGTWVVDRKQAETDSSVLIVDAYIKAKAHNVFLEFEGIRITGDTRAIALQGSIDPTNPDPLAKKANIWGYVGRTGYEKPSYKVSFEHGYASGDDNAADGDFTGRPLHPDHNVGLIMYEEVLSRVTSQLWTSEASGLWSKGGVYNSRYIFPTAHVYPLEDWELVAGFLTAWPDRPDGAIIRCRDSDKGDCNLPSTLQATSDTLGWEVDFGIKHRLQKHVLLALEGGAAKITDRVPLEAAGLNPKGKFFTLQTRLAYEF